MWRPGDRWGKAKRAGWRLGQERHSPGATEFIGEGALRKLRNQGK